MILIGLADVVKVVALFSHDVIKTEFVPCLFQRTFEWHQFTCTVPDAVSDERSHSYRYQRGNLGGWQQLKVVTTIVRVKHAS